MTMTIFTIAIIITTITVLIIIHHDLIAIFIIMNNFDVIHTVV